MGSAQKIKRVYNIYGPRGPQSGKYVFGLDLGGTKLASAVIDREGKILLHRRSPVDFAHGKRGFLQFVKNEIAFLTSAYPDPQSIGIASCGPLDGKSGALLQPTNFPKWGKISLGSFIKKEFQKPVFMINDAAASALAEGWQGGAKSLSRWIVLTLGTGLGTGVVMDRKVFTGGADLGLDAGHLLISDLDYPCGCGNRGCAESILSGTALWNRIKERELAKIKGTHELLAAARAGSRPACEIFREYSFYLARLILNLSLMYDPEVIYFSGGLASESDVFLPLTKVLLKKLIQRRPGHHPKLLVSKLGLYSGVLGGAFVAWER